MLEEAVGDDGRCTVVAVLRVRVADVCKFKRTAQKRSRSETPQGTLLTRVQQRSSHSVWRRLQPPAAPTGRRPPRRPPRPAYR